MPTIGGAQVAVCQTGTDEERGQRCAEHDPGGRSETRNGTALQAAEGGAGCSRARLRCIQ